MNKFKILLMIMLLSCNNYSDDNYQPINNSTDDNTIYVTSSSGNSYNSTASSNSDYFLSGNDKNGSVS